MHKRGTFKIQGRAKKAPLGLSLSMGAEALLSMKLIDRLGGTF